VSATARGIKNAFRNAIRSVSITAILALTIALALVMLLSMKAVQARIDDVKGSVGNTLTVTPAGARGFQGGGEPLTTAQIAKIEATPHVKAVSATLEDRWRTEGSDSFAGPGGSSNNGTTSLVSAIDPGTLGNRFNAGGGGGAVTQQTPTTFSLPISVTGTTAPGSTVVSDVNSFTIASGSDIDGTSSDLVALVGKALAAKNNLSVGSTFTAYDKAITVCGPPKSCARNRTRPCSPSPICPRLSVPATPR
jgi:putative ABC transport system permease protein